MDKLFSIYNVFIMIIVMILFLFLKEDGIIQHQSLLTQQNQLLLQIDDLSHELNSLKRENYLLQHNANYIEKIAREEYFYIFPREIIINF